MTHTTPNQFANMLDKRAADLDGIADRMYAAKMIASDAVHTHAFALRELAKSIRAAHTAGRTP